MEKEHTEKDDRYTARKDKAVKQSQPEITFKIKRTEPP
jgi:hypothetical protein